MKGKTSILNGPAGLALGMLQKTLLGALCGVGLMWTLSAVSPLTRTVVVDASHYVQQFSSRYPSVLLGLILGVGISLIWQAVKR